jgi:hypothetical protein
VFDWSIKVTNIRGGWIAKEHEGISGLEIKVMQWQLTGGIHTHVSVA